MIKMKVVEKLIDMEKDWSWYKKLPVIVKAAEITEEIEVHTREGVLKGYDGDFLIQGIEGEIYPCGKDIFWKTYKKHKKGA